MFGTRQSHRRVLNRGVEKEEEEEAEEGVMALRPSLILGVDRDDRHVANDSAKETPLGTVYMLSFMEK